jgi:hypothetical protein
MNNDNRIMMTMEAYNSNTPKDLFDRSRESFAWVMGLGCGQSHEFSAGEREGGCYEDVAEALETVVECAWILPVAASNVA